MRGRRIASAVALAGFLLAGTSCASASNDHPTPSEIPPGHPWRVSMTMVGGTGAASAANERDRVIAALDARLHRLGVTDAVLVRGASPDTIEGGFVDAPRGEVLVALEAPLGVEFRPVMARDDAAAVAIPPLDPSEASPDAASDLERAWTALDCAAPPIPRSPDPPTKGYADRPIVACSADGATKYVLAPAASSAADVASAESSKQQDATGATLPGEYAVTVTLTSSGAEAFSQLTGRLASLASPANELAIVVDGLVVSAPAVISAIDGGTLRISGNFTEDEATRLADDVGRVSHAATVYVTTVQRVDDSSE